MKLPICPVIALLSLAASANAQSLHHDGLLNEPAGAGNLTLSLAGKLHVSNIGSSGLDGVKIDSSGSQGVVADMQLDLLPGEVCWVRSEHGRPTGGLTTSALSITGTNAGVSLMPDFSALGQGTHGLRFYSGGQLVYQSDGNTGPVEVDYTFTPNHWEKYVRHAEDSIFGGIYVVYCFIPWNGSSHLAVMAKAHDGTLFSTDLIEVYSAPQPLDDVRSLEITANGPTEFTVAGEQMRFFDHWMHGLDDTQLDVQGATLQLGGTGDTGLSWCGQSDYGSMQLATPITASLPSSSLYLSATLPSGLTESIVGGGDDDHDLGGHMYTPDFSQLSSTTYTLEIYNQGQLIFSEPNRTGKAASLSSFSGFSRKQINYFDGNNAAEWTLDGTPGGSVGVFGGALLVADKITVRSEAGFGIDTSVDCWVFEAGGLNSPAILTNISSGEPDPCLGDAYCVGAPNSAGPGATMCASGSMSVAANSLVLEASGLPSSVSALLFYGPNQIQVPFGDGIRCVGGGLNRLQVHNTGFGGVLTHALDNTNPPTGAGQIFPGQTWNFQAWYRDPAAGMTGFNLSNGRSLVFLP